MACKLHFYYGAMNSSKSMRLLTTAFNFQEKDIHFVCFKPSIDDRDGVGVIHSRVGIERECTMVTPQMNMFIEIQQLKENDPYLKKVLIDECQFLSATQVNELGRVVDELDIDVMCYGLRTDFQTMTFEGSKRLLEIADTIEEVKSHCGCGRKAIINARFNENGEIVLNGEQVQIGGNEAYVPLCRKCYYKYVVMYFEDIARKGREMMNEIIDNKQNTNNETSN